jgi:prepilin-type N-terminal cleavage/methylation domain-containing protein
MRDCSSPSTERRVRAFTLLEMVIAIAIFALLMSGIFTIANGTLELGSDLAYAQDRALMRQNLVEFFRKSFRSLPGGAEITLTNQQRGGTTLPTIRVKGGGIAFSPGHALPPEASIEVYAEERPGGYKRIGIRGLDADQTLAAEQGRDVKLDPSSVLPLLDNVGKFEWRFTRGNANEWRPMWRGEGRPLFAELVFTLDDKTETRAVFWIPPVLNTQGLPPAPGPPPLDANGNPIPQATPVQTPPPAIPNQPR